LDLPGKAALSNAQIAAQIDTNVGQFADLGDCTLPDDRGRRKTKMCSTAALTVDSSRTWP
jgi:hypothetical protein